MIPVPGFVWRRAVARDAAKVAARLRFMTDEHHRVRDYAVRELPRAGRPLSPDEIAAGTGLPPLRVRELLDELERRLMFLFRDARGHVEWAYPVTAAATPHHLAFSSGERLDAA
jgi:hypothetical protein